MKEFNTDVLIVGGGLTGLLTAYTLSTLDYNICLVDGASFISDKNSNVDYRTTAIAEGSKKFFEKIGFWDKIKEQSEKINKIIVIDRTPNKNIKFSHPEDDKSLGYVVRNYLIKKKLIEELKIKKNVTIKEKVWLKDINLSGVKAKASFNNFNINAKLIIGADGKNSFIRSLIKTPQYKKKYDHMAIVINFSHSKNHNNIAHEIFLKSGPLAILPMKSSNKFYYNTSLIWSHSKEFANSMNKINANLRKKIIEEKVINYTGEINELFDTKIFELSSHINTRFYENKLVYVGDSAHSLHPIAGQGWNLGVRDVENIFKAITNADNKGIDIGSEYVCKNYHNLSFYDAYSLYQVTDKLNSIFLDEKSVSKGIRKIGFSMIEKNKAIKKKITNYAMGF